MTFEEMNNIRTRIRASENLGEFQSRDNSSCVGDVQVYFRNLPGHLCNLLDSYEVVLGCVAWLTHREILVALSRVREVSIIVQKEDFLRPDADSGAEWKAWLRKRYEDIRGLHADARPHELLSKRKGLPTLDEVNSEIGESTLHPLGPVFRDIKFNDGKVKFKDENVVIDPIRCAGQKMIGDYAAPRMHNKFMLFGRRANEGDDCFLTTGGGIDFRGKPYKVPFGLVIEKVWTGSFNMTKNATLSLENAVVINTKGDLNTGLRDGFYNEWVQILAMSEPLDWEHRYVAPTWRKE